MSRFLLLVLCIFLHYAGMAQTSGTEPLRKGSVAVKKQQRTPLGREAVRNKVPGSVSVLHPQLRKNSAVKRAVGDGTVLYGEVVHSDLMDVTDPDADLEDALTWGVYSFPAQEGTVFTEKLIHNTICANGGGAYRKGKLYFTSYYEGYEPGALMYLYFCTLDVNTWTLDKKALHSDAFTSISLDMTYDPVGDVVYMQAYPADAATATEYDWSLSVMNIETGLSTRVASMERMSMIACGNSGQLYGVRYNDGMFCKIDKTDGTVTEVGKTGVNPQYNGTGTFDFNTGKLYWSTIERLTGQSGLYEIDVTTGKADMITSYPNNEQVSCLYIPQADDICRLGDIGQLTADFSNASSTTGTISIKAPAVDASGNQVTGDITIYLYIDGSLKMSKQCAPGELITTEMTLEKGAHKVEAVATHPTIGKSARKAIDIWVGTDGPAAVTDFKVEKTGDYQATLTWAEPTGGAHGGTINPALVYYEIRRFPGNELITDEAVGNTFTDNITNKNLRYYVYTITGHYKTETGPAVQSNSVAFGEPAAIPYNETFDTFDDFKTYLVFNENKDEGFWGYNQDKQCAMYKYDTFNRGDDWLLSPVFRLEASSTYRLKFKARSDSWLYPEELEVKLGRGYGVENIGATLIPKTTLNHDDFREYEALVTIDETDNYFIGFHAVTVKGQYYLYIDDVELNFGPAPTVPGLVTDATVTPAAGGEKKAVITFTTPTVNYAGKPLEAITAVKIYRNAALIKAFDNPGTGEQLTYTDETPADGDNTYRIVASNASGDGDAVELIQHIGADVPMPPTEVRQTSNNSSSATPAAVISWTAPTHGINGGTLNPQDIKYNITDSKGRKVATGISGISYTDAAIDVSAGQQSLFYYVEAVTESGASDAVATDFITYGVPYQDAYNESFAEGKFTTRDWIITLVNPSPYNNEFYGRYWGLKHSKWDRGPVAPAQDGDNGCLIAYTDFLNVSSRIVSPKINVSGLKNPVLSFWFYHYFNADAENGYSHVDETMTVEAYVNGAYTELLATPIRLVNGNGWYRYDVKLKDFVGSGDFQIAFKTHNYLSYDMHIDNISVSDVKDNDLSIAGFIVPEKIAVNSSRELSATVHNSGANEASGYQVEFLRDGKVFETVAVEEALAFAADKVIATTVSPGITDAGKTYIYSVRVVYGKDENTENNISEEIRSEVPSNNLPVVSTLKADATPDGVKLTWNEPAEAEGNMLATEGFETYEAFTISNMGEWTLADYDRLATYTIQNSSSGTGDYDYPNAGEAMAYQVFNPGTAGITSKMWQPYLGNQMAVCFDAAGGVNNDWLISPEVKAGSKVSFMAKSVTALYGLEKFRFCYSSTDNEAGSFVAIGDVNFVPAGEWTRYEFTLPADARYFAINCVSENSYAMLIDEITYESVNPVILSLYGFNVYRDGVRINGEIVEEGVFTDNNVVDGTSYSYNVTAVYDKGESMFGNTANVVATTGITDVVTGCARVYTSDNTVWVDNACGLDVRIYGASGVPVYDGRADSNRFSVSLQSGVYVVAVNGKATKVVVR